MPFTIVLKSKRPGNKLNKGCERPPQGKLFHPHGLVESTS
jgi:hypothetical protein